MTLNQFWRSDPGFRQKLIPSRSLCWKVFPPFHTMQAGFLVGFTWQKHSMACSLVSSVNNQLHAILPNTLKFMKCCSGWHQRKQIQPCLTGSFVPSCNRCWRNSPKFFWPLVLPTSSCVIGKFISYFRPQCYSVIQNVNTLCECVCEMSCNYTDKLIWVEFALGLDS